MEQTLEQRVAKYALDVIEKHRHAGASDVARRYATLVRSVPSMVMQNGLGQTLAYLLADAEGKPDKPSKQLYQELQEWLLGNPSEERPQRVYRTGDDLITALMDGSRYDYQRAQEAVLALLGWMRKFADAYLPKGEE